MFAPQTNPASPAVFTCRIPNGILLRLVSAKAQELGVTISLAQWASLQPLQRFALIKLSRSSHENKNFLLALQEFKVID